MWYPQKIEDLDSFTHKVMEYGDEINKDHPGFSDNKYIERRKEIVTIADNYKHGDQIQTVEYTEEENGTWRTVYEKLASLYPKYACKQYIDNLKLLEDNGIYTFNKIPQLEDVSKFLKDKTGFTLRPVKGLLSSRDFLNGLAFRVFHSTQYIRHHSNPFYTPEPDVCHELLGHVPLFADNDFADFSQQIGIASLKATDYQINKLATVYWFTVEFGLCSQGGEVKAYGAGILSSFGELEYSMGSQVVYLNFDCDAASTMKYPITTYQPVYFVAESFQSAKDSMLTWIKNTF